MILMANNKLYRSWEEQIADWRKFNHYRSPSRHIATEAMLRQLLTEAYTIGKKDYRMWLKRKVKATEEDGFVLDISKDEPPGYEDFCKWLDAQQ